MHVKLLMLVHNFGILQRSWAHERPRRAYPEFIAELDRLTPDDVIWEPYSDAAVWSRAPHGLSAQCAVSPGLWKTTAVLVYDVAVEPHCPDRVMRQFGLRQPFPLPSTFERISRHDHRFVSIVRTIDMHYIIMKWY
jgi:hypothetical protein